MSELERLNALKEKVSNGNNRRGRKPGTATITNTTAGNSGIAGGSITTDDVSSGSGSGSTERSPSRDIGNSNVGTHSPGTSISPGDSGSNGSVVNPSAGSAGIVRRVIGNPNSNDGNNGGSVGNSGNGSSGISRNRTQSGNDENKTGTVQRLSLGAMPLSVDVPDGGTTKRRNTRKGTTSSLSDDVVMFGVQALFGCVSMLKNAPHWNLDTPEAQSIAEPLKKILDRQAARNPKAFQHAEEIAEIAAVLINVGLVIQRPLAIDKELKNAKGISAPRQTGTIGSITATTKGDNVVRQNDSGSPTIAPILRYS